ERDPEPFYPVDRPASFARDLLNDALDRLRLRGLIELTEWTREKGQGIRLTDAGRGVLADPSMLHQMPSTRLASSQPHDESTWERGEALRRAFLEPERGFVVRALLAVNIAAFAVSLFLSLSHGVSASEFLFESGSARANFDLGSLNSFMVVVFDQWWRLLTYGFLHLGLLHLAFNMSFLWGLGRRLESLWGHLRFAILYLFSMLSGGCMVLGAESYGHVVGASGALFGLLPSLAVLLWLHRDQLPESFVASLRQSVIINMIMGIVISTMPGVSWACHLGGALGGFAISFPLHYTRASRPWTRRLAWISIMLMFIAILFAVYVEYHWFEAPLERMLRAVQALQR
ncbi:MAG: rhomboid family intramembrane serine protease, partial [Gemmataceae bacterium]